MHDVSSDFHTKAIRQNVCGKARTGQAQRQSHINTNRYEATSSVCVLYLGCKSANEPMSDTVWFQREAATELAKVDSTQKQKRDSSQGLAIRQVYRCIALRPGVRTNVLHDCKKRSYCFIKLKKRSLYVLKQTENLSEHFRNIAANSNTITARPREFSVASSMRKWFCTPPTDIQLSPNWMIGGANGVNSDKVGKRPVKGVKGIKDGHKPSGKN